MNAKHVENQNRTLLKKDYIYQFLREMKASGSSICHYIYDLDALQRHISQITAALPKNCDMYYAMKANSESRILQAIEPYVAGFEVASQGEIDKGCAVLKPNRIIFGGPGKTDEELDMAITRGIRRLHIESVQELERLNARLEKHKMTMPVLLRVNLSGPFPNATLHMAGRPTQFGISEEEVDTVIQRALELPRITLEGFHFHSISNNLDASLHVQMMRLYFTKAKQWAEKHHFPLQHLNVGGGIGVNYQDLDAQFDWDAFNQGLHEVIEQEAMSGITLNFECGRYLTAHMGYYATEVIDMKQVHGTHYAILKGGTQHFRLPVSWQHNHPLEICEVDAFSYTFQRPTLTQSQVTFVGQLCTPKDVFSKERMTPQVRMGDVVVFQYAGAYGWSISHHDFLSHPHPEFVYLQDTKEEEDEANVSKFKTHSH